MALLWLLVVNLAMGLDGDECTHFTYFKGINDGICDRAIGWAEWIYFPNMFGDRTYEDFTQKRIKKFCQISIESVESTFEAAFVRNILN